jgi:hypothetical protein
LHFGHYIARCGSDHISYFCALKANLIMWQGVVLERWGCGLSVMLEKMIGCALIAKLRSILLMEADFNATNKTIYGQRMLQTVRKYNLMPEEIFSEKNCLADDGTLIKVLFYDIVHQTRLPAGISAVDADNCYDKIAHPIASMVFQALGVPKEAIIVMLTTIQDMKFFLRTEFGDSKDYAGSIGGKKTQGMCQGNVDNPGYKVFPQNRVWRFQGLCGIHWRKKDTGDVPGKCRISSSMDSYLYRNDKCPQTEGAWNPSCVPNN